MYGFVVGNGESRRGFDLNILKKHGIVYGCNSLFKDFKPHTLISVDNKTIDMIKKSGYEGEFVYFDRGTRRLVMRGKEIFNFEYRGWASGQTALWLICDRMRQHIPTIFMIGFDFYSKDDKINNIYKGTPCYRDTGSKPVDPKKWIYQCMHVFAEFRKNKFYRVQKSVNDFPVRDFEIAKNYETITYETMMKILGGCDE